MRISNRPTAKSKHERCVFAVGLGEEHQRACAEAAESAALARLDAVGLDELSSLIAERRPMALVVDDALYQFDPARFDDLADAVGSKCIPVDAARTAPKMLSKILEPLLARVGEQRNAERG